MWCHRHFYDFPWTVRVRVTGTPSEAPPPAHSGEDGSYPGTSRGLRQDLADVNPLGMVPGEPGSLRLAPETRGTFRDLHNDTVTVTSRFEICKFFGKLKLDCRQK